MLRPDAPSSPECGAAPWFDVRDVGYAYGRRRVLEAVSCRLEPGKYYGLLGPNGCGKTTLLDLLLGLKTPACGTVLFQGQPLSTRTRRELARAIALVPQEHGLHFPFTVEEIVLMGRHPYIGRFAEPTERDQLCAAQAMAGLGLTDLAQAWATELSGGEKQRVVLARALAQDTPVLLLDEPTASLDIRYALDIQQAIRRRVAERGVLALAVLHDLNLAAAFCDELLFLRSGRIHAFGPVRATLTPEIINAVYGVDAHVYDDPCTGTPRVAFRAAAGASTRHETIPHARN